MKEQDEDFLGPRLPREDETTDNIVKGCMLLTALFIATIVSLIMMVYAI
jgi:hypothetical protein